MAETAKKGKKAAAAEGKNLFQQLNRDNMLILQLSQLKLFDSIILSIHISIC